MKNFLLGPLSPSLSFGFSLLAFASLVSCGTTSATGGSDGGTTTVIGSTPLPCDINAIVVANCQSCHSNPPQSGAPMPLVTWEDFQATTPADPDGPTVPAGEHVYQTVERRINDAQALMPQPPNAPLDTADLATMDAWLNAGAPKTDGATCGGSSSNDVHRRSGARRGGPDDLLRRRTT